MNSFQIVMQISLEAEFPLGKLVRSIYGLKEEGCYTVSDVTVDKDQSPWLIWNRLLLK